MVAVSWPSRLFAAAIISCFDPHSMMREDGPKTSSLRPGFEMKSLALALRMAGRALLSSSELTSAMVSTPLRP